MNRLSIVAIAATVLIAACGGDDDGGVDANIDEFDIDPDQQDELDEVLENGDSAEGEYEFNEETGALVITVKTSSFRCGIESGETIEATVLQVSATTMVWMVGDDEDAIVTWTRVDTGTEGIAGVWQTDDPPLYLVLASDGSAQIIGIEELCEDDREKNENQCRLLQPDDSAITIDGNLSDWQAVSAGATLADDSDDYEGSDPGADLRALKTSYRNDTLSILMQLYHAPSTNFSTQSENSYRLTVTGDNGLSIIGRIAYDAEGSQWTVQEGAGALTVATGDDGIEWQLDISDYNGEGFETIDMILIEPRSSSGTLDAMTCGFLKF